MAATRISPRALTGGALPLALALAWALGSTPARAQALGRSGDVSFAGDRLMGFYLYDEGNNVTAVGLGGPPAFSWYTWYTTPRLGIDGFVIDHLSIGGSITYVNVDIGGRRGNRDGFLLYPRVGYAIDFNDAFGFWPRGGLTFSKRDAGGDDDEMALSLEGMFWAAPVPHFAFLFGPAIDLGLVGDGSEAKSFGIVSAGVLGWL